MKKYLAFLACFALVLVSVSAFAGGIKQNTNQSAEFMITLNRNASIDADSVFFNPAGTAMMKDGLYLYVDYQCILQSVAWEAKSMVAAFDGKFDVAKNAYYFGNVYLNWVKDNVGPGSLAISLGFEPIGGGGSATYDKPLLMAKLIAASAPKALPGAGLTTTGKVVDMKLVGSSAFYGVQANVAYSFLKKMVSLAAGYRFVYDYSTYDGYMNYLYTNTALGAIAPLSDSLKSTVTGMSHGIIGGITVAPLQGLNVGDLIVAGKLEWHTKMVTTADTKLTSTINPLMKAASLSNVLASKSGLADGAEGDETLPMLLGVGLSYAIKGITVSWSFNYYLNQLTDWQKGTVAVDADGSGTPTLGDYVATYETPNSYDTGLGLEYTLPSIPLWIGLGFMYTYDSTPGALITDINEASDSYSAGIGLGYTFAEKYKLMVGYNFVYYETVDVVAVNPAYTALQNLMGTSNKASKISHAVTIGFQGKLL